MKRDVLPLFKFSRFAVPLVLTGLVCSCATPEKMRQAQHKIAVKRYVDELEKQLSGVVEGDGYRADWNKAENDLFFNNPQIIKAYFSIDDSNESRMRIWKNMIPSLSAGLSESATLGDLGDLFVDSNLRVSSFISLGNVIDMPKRIAVLRMRHMGVEFQSELTMRNEVIALYRVIREQELLDLEGRALEWERDYLEEGVVDESDSIFLAEISTHVKKEEAYKEKKKKWYGKVSELMMRRYSHVRFDLSGVPNIYYRGEDLDFSDTKRWGVLQMNVLALQLVAEESQMKSAYARYLPDPNLSVSAPPLYSTSGGQGFSFEEIRIGPSINWRLDTKGNIGRQIRRLKRNQPLKDWTRAKRTRDEVAQLLEGQAKLIMVQKELAEQQGLIADYKKLVADGLVDDPVMAMKWMRKEMQAEVALKAAEIDICTSLWLIDETRWTETTKAWKRSRIEMEKRLKLKDKKKPKKKELKS